MQVTLFGDSHLSRLQLKEIASVQVCNQAIGGFSTEDGKRMMEDISIEDDDIVVLCFGSNDAAPWKQIPLDDFENNYEEILNRIPSSNIIIITPPAVDEDRQAPPGRSNALLAQYAKVSTEICPSNANLVDMYSITKEGQLNDDIYIEDGVHLNENGYKLLAGALLEIINSMLQT